MPKILFSLIAFLSITSVSAFSQCDQSFPTQDVRYGQGYQFYDEFNNGRNVPVYLNTYEINFENPQYIDSGWPFNWTAGLRGQSFVVSPGQNIEALATTGNGWLIAGKPSVRSSGYDFGVQYRIDYDTSNNYPDSSDDSSHYECAYYRITWCWDGILDSANGEQCDLGAQNGQPGSSCSATCTPIVVPVSCIPGPTTWPQSNPVTSATAGLCPAGGVVGGFTSTVVGTTTNYAWSCNGSPVGGSCSASFTPTGPSSCIPWPTTGAQGAPVTSGTTGLCPAGGAVGGFASTVAGTTTNYAWSCNGSPVGGSCSASYTPGWGGGGPTCIPGNFVRDVGGVVPAPISSATSGLCLPGEVVGNFVDTPSGTSHRYSWSCNTISAGWACVAFFNGGWGGGWGGGWWGWWGLPTTIPGSESYCWNSAVERPNGLGIHEDCDTGTATLWCVECHIASTNPGSVLPGKLTITTPGNSSINIDEYKLIIGNQVPVFSSNDIISFETNNSMYLDNITATVTNKSPLISGTRKSNPISGWMGTIRFKTGENIETNASGAITKWDIYYEEKTFWNTLKLFDGSELQSFKGNTSTIVSGSGFENTDQTLPMFMGTGLYASLQYLEAPFNIRVSRPIIGNTAGWSAFIGSILWNSVNTVVQTFFDNLRSGNFTTSTVSTSSSYALSSATRSISGNSTLSQTIASGSTTEEWSISNASRNTSGISTITSIGSEYDIDPKSTPLGDTTNIRVFKNGNVSIDGNLDLSGVKTVIVENGNLIINSDIRYADPTSSFAWIVKNGKIIIADGVKNIAGVYVTLAGAIESNRISTPNRLTVDGSLYGNTSDLVNNRSYVRGQAGYTALNVGVVVNYSNRAIMFPPPFLSRFLDQYSLQRVAR